MSNLLSQASLVMIPSGYKEDVVYSQIPTNGNGDLSFTRASNGTRVNSAGLVEVCPWNLCTYSNDFSSNWSLVGSSKSTGVTDPIGNSNAIKLMYTTATSGHYTNQAIQLTGSNAHSVYAKAGELQFLQIASAQTIDEYVNFNLSTGAIGTYGSRASNVQIENVGNGWYRCSVVFTSGTLGIYLAMVQSASSDWFGVSTYAGANSTDGLYLYGGQVNTGALKPYFPTTDRLNVPRLTYQNGGGGCPSLLLEKQSTNVLLYSEQFDNAVWSKQNTSVTANATTSPDGTQNADKLIANTTNARHLIFQAFVVSTTHTFTTYAKAGENSFLIMRLDTDTPEVKTWFNLSNGTIGTSQGGSPTITSVGNGWYRCSVQFVSSTSQTIYAVLYTATTDNQEVFAGNGTDGTFVWGAQLEASSYPTSYIPTTSSSATRVADACFKTGISSLIGQTEGTIFLDVDYSTLSGLSMFLSIRPNSSNKIEVYRDGGTIYGEVTSSASFAISATKAVGTHKIAFAYKSGDSALYIDGVLIGQNTTAFTYSATLADLYINQRGSGAAFVEATNYKEVILFKTRLTNAELAQLTA